MQALQTQAKTTPWALLARLVAPYKGLGAATLLTLCCDITGMLIVPTELAGLLNSVLAGGDMGQILLHGGRMLAAALLGSLGCIVSYRLASRLAANVGRDLRCAVYEHSLAFSAADFTRFGAGTMITRTLSDANVVQQTLLMTFIMLGPAPVTAVIAIVMAFSIDRVMGLVLLAVTLAVLVISIVAVAKSAPIFVILQSRIDSMNVHLRESITGVRPIRAFGKEAYEEARLDQTFSDYAERAIRVNLVFSVTDTLTYFCMNAVEALIFWVGADRVGAHAMGIGSISAVLEYAMLIMFFMMMAQFALLQIPRAMACLERAAEVLDLEPSIAWKDADAKTPALAPSACVARFDHVSFRYDDADEDMLRDLDFSLFRGQTCAIVGNTGSGKSTVAKLLLRFVDATSGTLEFNENNVRDLSKRDLLNRIAYAPQKAWLFSGTIADNLRHGDCAADDERLWHALDVAQAGFVRELPDGLATNVAQGGTNFSGGQRQRLAIARALVRKADLYIFDDSFSALDYKTDASLRRALKEELADAAVLIIAQRVSTIRDADQIVVLSDGRVVGLGAHDELRRTCPTYQEICDSQERGGADDGSR